MKQPKNKGIFFDLYGTLLIYGDMSAARLDWMSVLFGFLKEHGLSISKELFTLHCDRFIGKSIPTTKNNEMTVLECRVHALYKNLGIDVSSRDIHDVTTNAVNAWQKHIYRDPEAIPLLKKLRKNKTLALVTNFDHPPHIYSLLKDLGIAELFKAIVISGEVGVKKPNPKILNFALKQTKLQPSEVIYVGDTLVDVQISQAAGVCPIIIQRNQTKENYIILDFIANHEYPQSISGISPIIMGTKSISKLSELVKIL
jgi:HAD superfamily hydrolase (TIGR01549 family)